MESEINGNEYTLMLEFDFSKPITATIIFDSDEDEFNKETNTPLSEKHDSDHEKIIKYLDMPSLDEHNSTAKFKLDDVVSGMIKNYICKTKKTCDKESPKRKYSPTSNNTIKSKLKRNTNNMKEIRNQHNESSCSSSNNYKNSLLASYSAEPSGPQSNDNICETKKTYHENPPNRKSTTSNNTIEKTNNMKEITSQYCESSSTSTNNHKSCLLASFSAELSGPQSNVSNDIYETKQDKIPPDRKSSTTSNNILENTYNIKEIRNQHNESSFSSTNNFKNCPIASFSAEPRGPQCNVSNDICGTKPTYYDKPPNNILENTYNMKEKRNQHNESSSSSTNSFKNCPLASFSAELSGPQSNVSDDICETKKTHEKPPNRKSATTSHNTIEKTYNAKEIRNQHNESSSSSNYNYISFPVASFTAELSGPQSNVSDDICETKKTHEKPPNRKSATTSHNTIEKTYNAKEIRNQHNESSSSSNYNYISFPVASFTAEPSGQQSNVSNNIRDQNSSCNSNLPSNIVNEQPILSTFIEPKAEPIEDPDLSNCVSEKINNRQNTSTPSSTDKNQALSASVDQPIQPIREPWTSPNIATQETENPLDNSASDNLPTNGYNGKPIFASIEIKAKITKDSNPKINLSYEITRQQHILTTSNLPTNTDNRQSIPALIEQRGHYVEHPSTSAKDVSSELRNGIDGKIGNQWDTSISILPPNPDSSCSFTNVTEEIRNPLNTSSYSSPTNTNDILVSTNATSNIQKPENNDNSVNYAHLKPLLDTVSEHLILIWKKSHNCSGVLKDKCVQNFEFNEELRKLFYNYKIRLFDLSYSTVVTVILPRAHDKTFIKNFIDNTIALTKSDNIKTTKEISILYMEMISWTKNMKQRIASESVFDRKIMRQPLESTCTNSLSEIVKESINTHSTYNHTYSIRPPETQRPPPWMTTSNPPSSYTNKPPPPYTKNIPQQYMNTIRPQTYINNVITPEQTKMISSIYSEHQQLSAQVMQKKTTKLNQRQQVTVAKVARRGVNPAEGPRQDFHSANVTQVKNSINNYNVNVSSNHIGETYQHYPSTYFTATPNPNHAQNAHCLNNIISANNSTYPRAIEAFKSPNSTSSHNHCYRPNDASSQGINNYPNNAYQNQVYNIHQESNRSSISRDSGFYSPREIEQQEPSTSLLITHVTSLNPNAVNITEGNCFVCGKNTNQKCVGCYATYYCSYGCQNFDWRNHMMSCNTNQELRNAV